MGSISAFFGMVLYMYPEKGGKHHRPHIHVVCGDDECVLSVPEGGSIGGFVAPEEIAERSDVH